MDYASEEVLDKCHELAGFGAAITSLLAQVHEADYLPHHAIVRLATMNHRVAQEFGPRLIALFTNPHPSQDEAYEILFAFREAMGPVVEGFVVELDKAESDTNLPELFHNLFIF